MTRILVVEDDRSLARLAQLNLEAEGYDVEICHEGRQAIANLQTSIPDIVLLDLRLPTSISGWDVLTCLRQDHRLRAVPVVILSAFAHDQDRKQAAAAGANAYLVKPFGIEELFACVRGLLGGASDA